MHNRVRGHDSNYGDRDERGNLMKHKSSLVVAFLVSTSVLFAAGSPASAAPVVKKIAFFGYWKSNSFTKAVLAGVNQAAKAAGVKVVDLSTAAYDGVAQVKAVQDQTVKHDAQVYIFLATDPVGMATAAREAIAKGITVVAAYAPLGAKFDTLQPQVPGLIVAAETPVGNGQNLAKLAAKACATRNPCNVAYLEGLKTLPLDNARTAAFKKTLAAIAPQAKLVADVEGGYALASGKKAAQDVIQSNPDVNVMVGSSQAIIGASSVVDTSKVALIGNGSSTEAFAGVNNGTWFGLYNLDVKGIGVKAAQMGIAKARGKKINPVFNVDTLKNVLGTKDVIAGQKSTYSDLG